MIPETKRLLAFTAAKGATPGLAMLHCNAKGAAWASDGAVELYLPAFGNPFGNKYSVNADQLVKLLGAAGPNAELEVQHEDAQVLVSAGNFAAQLPLGATEHFIESMYKDLKVGSKHCKAVKLARPVAFTEALKCMASFASLDAAAGVHWTAVLLRADWMYASNRGFSIAGAKVVDEPPVSEADVLVPARACLAVGNAVIVEVLLNEEDGVGAFKLKDGEAIVFRMVAAPAEGYPDAGAVLAGAPADEENVWSPLDDNFSIGLQQAYAVTPTKDARVALKRDEEAGWYLYAKGFGEVSVDLAGFVNDGCDIILSPDYWNNVVAVGSEIAPHEDNLWLRSEMQVEGGAFSVLAVINSYSEFDTPAAAPAEAKAE